MSAARYPEATRGRRRTCGAATASPPLSTAPSQIRSSIAASTPPLYTVVFQTSELFSGRGDGKLHVDTHEDCLESAAASTR